jgi:polysaccharide biosynthesis transport protein
MDAIQRFSPDRVPTRWVRPPGLITTDVVDDDTWAQSGQGHPPRRMWDVIVNQRWLIVAFTLLAVAAAAAWSFTTPPSYKATTVIQIDPERPRVVMFPEVISGDEMYNERVFDAYYGTQFEILTSRAVLGRVESALGLDQHEDFNAMSQRTRYVRNLVARVWPGLAAKLDDASSSGFEGLERYVDVEPVKRSRLVRITAQAPDAELAAMIPNRVATEYISMVNRERKEASETASRWLETQLAGLRTRSQEASGTVQRFVRQNDLVPNPDGRLDYVMQQLEGANRAYTEAENERIQKVARAKMITSADSELAAAALGSEGIRDLKAERARLEREMASAQTVYGPRHPKMIELEASLENARQRLEVEVNKGRSAVEEEASAAERRAAELGRRLDTQRRAAIQQYAQGMQLQLLKREADAGDTVYGDLVKRLKELQLAAQMHVSNIRVIDAAERPTRRVGPRHARDLMLGMVCGLFGGLGLAFVRELGDKTLRTPREVDILVRLPTVGAVPSIRGYARRALPQVENLPARAVETVTIRWTETMAGETFRSIRALVCHGRTDGPPRTILVTSAQPAEGKSFISVNLAVALAGTGQPVLLVDADLRRASCHQAFDIDPSTVGLSSVLAHGYSAESAIVGTDVPNLAFLPAGPRPPDPAALLSSERARRVFGLLREQYGFVVIDSPPLLTASDAAVVSLQVEGVLLVVRAHATPLEAARLARDRLERLGANIIGVVLNDVRPSRNRDFYANYG